MGSIQYSDSLDYPIKMEDGTLISPSDNNSGKKACWRWSQKKLIWGIEHEFVVFKKDKNSIWTVYTKQYLYCDNEGHKIERTNRPNAVINQFSSTQASKNLEKVFGKKVFNYSKPVELIGYLLSLILNEKQTILDFFAGSGTTAHAVMQLNAKDGGNRQCILIQKDFEKNDSNYNLCEEVTYERCKRVIEGYTNLKGEQVQGLAGNNLRYFKTDFVDYTLNDDDMKFAITGKCTEMLCLRENVFTVHETSKSYKIFKEGKKKVAIFYDMYSSDLQKLREVMNATEGEKVLYYFSLDNEPNEQAFSTWNDIIIQPIPKKILDLYKQLFRVK
jgi:adenine-specific DNA-methyltransferase